MVLYCSQCGYKLPDDVLFCPNCGTSLSPAVISAITEHSNATSIPNNTGKLEADMIDEVANFIGPNAMYYIRTWQGVQKKRWPVNFAALFLSFFWLGYRKMYQPIFIGAGCYLLVMLMLSLGGYTFHVPFALDPASIWFTVIFHLLAAFLGNRWYKKHVLHNVAAMNQTGAVTAPKRSDFKKYGGVGFSGVVIAVFALLIMFAVPPSLFSTHNDAIDTVRHGYFEGHPWAQVDDVLSQVFEHGSWQLKDRYGQTNIVTYSGSLSENDEMHDVSISFYLLDDSSTFETDTIIVDHQKLDQASAESFIAYLFSRYKH